MAEVNEIKEITVRLRVVGVFYDEMVTVPDEGKVTIRHILDKAQETSQKTFRYRAELRYTDANKRVLSLNSFTHKISELDPVRGNPSLGNRKREAGIYEIRETVDPINGNEIVHAWQYYVIRKGKPVSNASQGTGPFDVSPARPAPAQAGFLAFDKQGVEDGDEIVWRNVSIARGPTTTKEIE